MYVAITRARRVSRQLVPGAATGPGHGRASRRFIAEMGLGEAGARVPTRGRS